MRADNRMSVTDGTEREILERAEELRLAKYTEEYASPTKDTRLIVYASTGTDTEPMTKNRKRLVQEPWAPLWAMGVLYGGTVEQMLGPGKPAVMQRRKSVWQFCDEAGRDVSIESLARAICEAATDEEFFAALQSIIATEGQRGVMNYIITPKMRANKLRARAQEVYRNYKSLIDQADAIDPPEVRDAAE